VYRRLVAAKLFVSCDGMWVWFVSCDGMCVWFISCDGMWVWIKQRQHQGYVALNNSHSIGWDRIRQYGAAQNSAGQIRRESVLTFLGSGARRGLMQASTEWT
jgi:hypothetical protein